VYAAAQGPVVTGGFVAAGAAGNRQTVNHPTVGRIPNGAIIERAPPTVAPAGKLRLQLRQADFTTAARVAEALNKRFSSEALVARAENSAAVAVDIPAGWASRPVEFVAEIENLTVEADRPLKIVVNERTGTIVLGKEVQIAPVAILHGALSVEVRTQFEVSQPGPLGRGETAVVPQVKVESNEAPARNVVLNQGATVEDLVRALQAIGSTARDIIAVLQNMRAAGALSAEIEVI
jgi:flagellar P-ring protein precursor FlgI